MTQRLDVRVNKSIALKRARMTLFTEIVNLLNRDNARFDDLNGYDSQTGRARLSFDKMFPILPSLGLVIDF